VGAQSPPIIVAALDATSPAGEMHCIGSRGDVKELAYEPNSDKTWRIAPEIPFEQLTLTVSCRLGRTKYPENWVLRRC
jgi:hypothetical protein